MCVDQMRNFIIKYYPGTGWKNKVKTMTDEQVIAIYYKFVNKKPIKKEETIIAKESPYVQLTIGGVL